MKRIPREKKYDNKKNGFPISCQITERDIYYKINHIKNIIKLECFRKNNNV